LEVYMHALGMLAEDAVAKVVVPGLPDHEMLDAAE
jgi:hypothetical protein